MQLRQLGKGDLELTTIGLGTWAMGGDGWAFAWGPQDDQASIKAIQCAIERGVNWIDGAAVYGLGHAEEVIGQAIRGLRDRIFVASKCGRIWDESRTIKKSLRAESIKREVDASLRRLGIDEIDLYQIHWPEPDEEIEEGWSTVVDLIQSGKVRCGGVCNFNLSQLKRVHAIHPVASLQPPYSMFKRDIEAELLPYCAEQGIGVLAYSPMQAGLLTGKFTRERVASLPESDWRRQSPFFTEPQLSINLKAVESLKAVAKQKGITVAQLALAWVLRHTAMTSAIAGARSPEQIEETVQAGELALSSENIAEIESILAEREKELEQAE